MATETNKQVQKKQYATVRIEKSVLLLLQANKRKTGIPFSMQIKNALKKADV